jgi:hypothetical protein
MTRIAKMLLAAVLPVAAILPALAAHTHVATPSAWTLNLKESDFGGGPAVKSDVETVTVDTEQRLAWSDVTVDDKGKTIKTSWQGPADGSMHPIQGDPGTMGSWTAATDSGHIVTAGGTITDQAFTLLDPKKIVFKVTVKDKAGHTTYQTLVYNRTK